MYFIKDVIIRQSSILRRYILRRYNYIFDLFSSVCVILKIRMYLMYKSATPICGKTWCTYGLYFWVAGHII